MRTEGEDRELLRKRIEEAACLELENYQKYKQQQQQQQQPFKRELLKPSNNCDYMQVFSPKSPISPISPISNNLPAIMNEDINEEKSRSRLDVDVDDINPEDAYYQDTAFFCLSKKSVFRKWAIKATLSPVFLGIDSKISALFENVLCYIINNIIWFERITMTIILLNCVTLGLYDPYDENCSTQKCIVLEKLETFIYAYFVLEMLIKIIAFGFFGQLGYIADSWNRLDLFIVMAGTFELVYGDGEFLSSVRAVRVLRPLRAINRVPSIRILVTLLLDTLPMLGNVFILCVLILMVFAIIGVQLWQGILRNRCYLDLPANTSMYLPNQTLDSYYIQPEGDYWSFICSSPENKGDVSCLDNTLKGHYINKKADTCVSTIGEYINKTFTNQTFTNNSTCIDWNLYYTKCQPNDENPHYGAISFDNAGIAFIAIFQSITLEGWADIMYYLQDAYSSWVWVYFVALIVLGSYFLTNLCLVVVATQFSETRQRESALMDAARRRNKSSSSTTFTFSESGNKGCYNQILSLLRHYLRRSWRRLKRKLFNRNNKELNNKTKHNKDGNNRLIRKNRHNNTTKNCLKSKDLDANSVHFHHHHHHHIHHHHVHVCPNNNLDKHVQNDQSNISKKRESININDSYDNSFDKSIPAIMPPPPQICIDSELNDSSEHNKSIPTLPMNPTALIIPDTTVVICHSGSLNNALSAQSPLTTVALYPSLSKLHSKRSSNENSSTSDAGNEQSETLNLGASYRSVGDINCCSPKLSPEEMKTYEKQASCVSDYNSDYSDSSDSSDNDSCDDEDCDHKHRGVETKQISSCKRNRLNVKKLCEKNYFKVSIMVAIFLNTVTMAMEHYQQPDTMTKALDIFNTIFTAIFTIEMVLKLTGYGFYGYIKDAFNVFDGIVVIISIVELTGDNQGGVSVLRTFRLMRIFKLVRFLPTLQKQIQVMLETLDSVMTFLGLLTIFIFTSSILGMHLFGGKMKSQDGGPVRHNFDNLMWSLITVFQVLTQEDWNQVLYDAMRSTSQWASVYFIFLMIIGNYILFNLLVAILVEGFSTETEGILSSPLKSPVFASRGYNEDSDYPHEDMDYDQIIPSQISQAKSLPNINVKVPDESFDIPDKRENFDFLRVKSVSESAINRQVRFSTCTEYTFTPVSPTNMVNGNLKNEEQNDQTSSPLIEKQKSKQTKRWCCYTRSDYALFLFGPKNKYRIKTQNLVSNPWFDNAILFFILLNCVIMAMERPDIKPGSTERKVIDYSNHVFTVVFFIEMCIKIFACGFYWGDKNTYLKNNWNRIDFVLVVISLVDLVVTYIVQSKSGVLGMLKVFRAFRTLRPLRVISRAPGLKIVVETLIASLAPIGNLVVVAMVFFTIFGILGVQLFKGSFYYCSKDYLSTGELVFNRTECENAGEKWINKKYNFDNLAQALFTLFVFATKDGWVSLMYDGIDAVGVDMQPRKNHNPWAFLYFVSFLLIAGFVVINMVVGVIIDNFQKCRIMVEDEMDESEKNDYLQRDTSQDKYTGNASIIPIIHSNPPSTPASLHDHTTQHSITKKVTILLAGESVHSRSTKSSTTASEINKYEIPLNLHEYSLIRRKTYNVVSHYKFDLMIAVVIGLNVFFMALEFYRMPEKLIIFLRIMNYIFTAIFILEAIFKIYGFGPRLFFAQRWNQLDIVIVFLSIIGIIFEELNSSLPINPTIIRIMRVLRIARVLKILKAADGIQRLLNCVSESLPQVGNLTMLFMLIFFIFSALGIELFGGLDCTLDECHGISRHAHFDNFGYALLTLFRISTGDNWSGILKDCINSKLCPESCDMMPYVAPIYFAIFVLASQFVLVNVVVAVLMKQLEDAKSMVDDTTRGSSSKLQDKLIEGLNDSLHRISDETQENTKEKDILSENFSMIANTGDVGIDESEFLELQPNLSSSQIDLTNKIGKKSNDIQKSESNVNLEGEVDDVTDNIKTTDNNEENDLNNFDDISLNMDLSERMRDSVQSTCV